ncbi:formamidase [Mycobacterium sp. SMC-4]|uniref:formamidase n=1 Tax=Mycobacterium sp. SMC-4 TaxID=2857059 RepID=UPI003D063595
MPDVVFPLDPDKRFDEQDLLGHTRWHPDIPPVATVRRGDTFRVHCRDWFDGDIRNTESADDILNAPFHQGHKLSGPFAVEGAKPGDLLVVDIVDIGPTTEGESGPLPGESWGYTGIFARRHGGGFLQEEFPDAYKAIWEFADGHATSRHLPGVRIGAAPHPGLMGTAPSSDLLAAWNKREAKLIATKPLRVPPLALPPMPKGALLGQASEDDVARLSLVAAQTAPPRENGGNQDIKNLTKGSRIFYPVFVDGAHLSVGDLHYSQGDGEITFCGAIEMGGYIDLHVDVIPGGMDTYKVRDNPIFVPGDGTPTYDRWVTFSGISVTRDGKQKHLDPYVAYQRACLNAIDYLTAFGYSREQAYLLLGAAPIEGHLSSVVDIPNACATVYLPTAIFDFDIEPSTDGPHQVVTSTPPPRADASNLPDDAVFRAIPKDKRALLPTAQQLGGRAARPLRAALRKLLR